LEDEVGQEHQGNGRIRLPPCILQNELISNGRLGNLIHSRKTTASTSCIPNMAANSVAVVAFDDNISAMRSAFSGPSSPYFHAIIFPFVQYLSFRSRPLVVVVVVGCSLGPMEQIDIRRAHRHHHQGSSIVLKSHRNGAFPLNESLTVVVLGR